MHSDGRHTITPRLGGHDVAFPSEMEEMDDDLAARLSPDYEFPLGPFWDDL
jgi:hypothetical protein